MTDNQLISRACETRGMTPPSTPPVQVAPGVFMFQSVDLHPSCRKNGRCRQTTHYAVLMDNKVTITP